MQGSLGNVARYAALMLLVGSAGCAAAPEPAGHSDVALYQLGLLRKGPNWTGERNALEDSLQTEHLRNMRRLYEDGLMIAAGPFEGGGDLSGLFVFGGASVDQIERETQRDPRIRTGRLTLDLHTWQAPAGIGLAYKRRAERGLPDSMLTLQFGLVKRGAQWPGLESRAALDIWQAHGEAAERWVRSGHLLIRGPLLDAGDRVEIMVYKADSAVARQLVAEDPAVQAGAITVDLVTWWTAYGTMPGDTL